MPTQAARGSSSTSSDIRDESSGRPSSGAGQRNRKRKADGLQALPAAASSSSLAAAVKDEAALGDPVVVKAEEEGSSMWVDLRVGPGELRPAFSLTMGQAFNWKRREGHADEWVGVVGRRLVAIRQTPHSTLAKELAHAPPPAEEEEEEEGSLSEVLSDYFQLQVRLSGLYEQWSAADSSRLQVVARHLPGVRVLRQDPVECLFSFICSSNNNIPRITLILDRLRAAYGTPLLRLPGGGGPHCCFPSVAALAQASEADLRQLGLGYRARFIVETAKRLQELGGSSWLRGLRTQSRAAVQESLLQFPGVGRKVADCVALFSLDQADAIPVDTHVWRIACRDYDPTLKAAKSLTPGVYERVGELFRVKFGPYAGWAHSLLFAAELPAYRVLLPSGVQEEMAAFRAVEKEEKTHKRQQAQARRQQRLAAAAAQQEGEAKKKKRGGGRGGGAAAKGGGAKQEEDEEAEMEDTEDEMMMQD